MNSKECWEEICGIMNTYQNVSERDLQMVLEGCILNNLGWKKYKGDVDRPSLQFGASHYGIPDAVLKYQNEYVLCIELKRLSVETNNKFNDQLFSYMRQLKLSFGILWGNTLQVFYDDISDTKPAIKVCEIAFDAGNSLGVFLVENLNKENFTFNKFKEFCLNMISQKSKEEENLKNINFLCSEDGIKYIKDLLLKEYPEEVVKSLNININPLVKENERYQSIVNKFEDSVKLEKRDAIDLCVKCGFINIKSDNTTFATLNNYMHCYPANVSQSYLRKDWYIILNNEKEKCLNVLKIPANTFTSDKLLFKTRRDRGSMEIYINDNGTEFMETKRQISFKQFFIKKINY